MIEELYELILGENGFVVTLRCENKFDELMFSRIVQCLKQLVEIWEKDEFVSKKAMLAIVELIECLSRNSDFLCETDAIRVEDACFEIKDIINELYQSL